MKLKDQFRFVQQNMKKNRTRVFMTILATAMACAFLIVLASVGFGLHKSIIKETTEQRIVTQIDVHGKEERDGAYRPLTEKDIEALENLDNVKAVVRRQALFQEGSYKIGEYGSWAQTYVTHIPSEIKAGFELSAGALPEKENEIIVGYDFANSLVSENAKEEDMYDEKGVLNEKYKYQGDLVGKELTFTAKQWIDGEEKKKDISVIVAGIGKKPTREWVMDQNVFISQETLKEIEAFTGTPRGMMNDPNSGEQQVTDTDNHTFEEVKVYARNLEAVEGVIEKLEEQNYASYSVVSELKQINMIFTIVKAGLILIGTIAILIASIGIYNTMTMAVTERAPDIGIMKAIGANPRTIKNIFLLESSYIGLIGALIGTVVSYVISFAVNFAIPMIIQSAFGEELPEGLMFSHIPFILPLICIIICYIVTILSGLRPAQRATKIDVLKAMRREV